MLVPKLSKNYLVPNYFLSVVLLKTYRQVIIIYYKIYLKIISF